MSTQHPFDKALALHHSDIRVGHFMGSTSPDYWNMVGPFGGATAALVLQSVMRHPDVLGTPIALTVNYAAALEAFGEKDLVDLTLTIATMNAINRMGISFRMKPRARA